MVRPTPLTAYLFWAGLVAAGALLALIDRRWTKRPLLGLGLVLGIIGGYVVTRMSPFDFVTGGYYMEGVLIFGGAALALIGYVLAMASLFAYEIICVRRPR